MKTILKFLFVTVCTILGAAIPCAVFYFAWSWAMSIIPPGEWAALVKLGVSFVMIATGGTITLALAILFGSLACAGAVVSIDTD